MLALSHAKGLLWVEIWGALGFLRYIVYESEFLVYSYILQLRTTLNTYCI